MYELSTMELMLLQKDPHPTAEVAIRINVDDAEDMSTEFQVLGPVSDRFDALVIPKFTSETYRRVGMLAQVHFEKKSFCQTALG
jgi:hypothetical protein